MLSLEPLPINHYHTIRRGSWNSETMRTATRTANLRESSALGMFGSPAGGAQHHGICIIVWQIATIHYLYVMGSKFACKLKTFGATKLRGISKLYLAAGNYNIIIPAVCTMCIPHKVGPCRCSLQRSRTNRSHHASQPHSTRTETS